jgi:two-component system sensor histidine kinase ChiS
MGKTKSFAALLFGLGLLSSCVLFPYAPSEGEGAAIGSQEMLATRSLWRNSSGELAVPQVFSPLTIIDHGGAQASYAMEVELRERESYALSIPGYMDVLRLKIGGGPWTELNGPRFHFHSEAGILKVEAVISCDDPATRVRVFGECLIGGVAALEANATANTGLGAAILGMCFVVLLFILSGLVLSRKASEQRYLSIFTAFAILYSTLVSALGAGWIPLGVEAALRVKHIALMALGFSAFAFAMRGSGTRSRKIISFSALLYAVAAAAALLPDPLFSYSEAGLALLAIGAPAAIAAKTAIGAIGCGPGKALESASLAAFGLFVIAERLLWGMGSPARLLPSLGLALPCAVHAAGIMRGVVESYNSVEYLSGYLTQVSSSLQRFIPREFVNFLDKTDVVDLSLGDHVKKEMSIFFSDIRAFTRLSEKLTPEENFAFINSYLSRMVPIIQSHGGFVDKYVGDAIMALYPGAAGADEAVRSAIEMQAKMVEYNKHRANCGYIPLAMGVGVHTGTLMLGIVGTDERMESTVISDAVNLASRLESITKAFNISLAISEQTFKQLEDPGKYLYRFIGKVKVKGKAEPISVFEIFDGIDEAIQEKKIKANTYFEQGMMSYYQKDFSGALSYFKRVLEILPQDGAASFYLDNCILKSSM